MKKSEAKAMLKSLKPKIDSVENESSAELESLLESQLHFSRKRDFSIWFQKLPDNVVEYLKHSLGDDSIEKCVKSIFVPHYIFKKICCG